MKKIFLTLLIPVLLIVACKNEKKQSPDQLIDEATNLASMHVAGDDFEVDIPQGWRNKDTTINGVNIYFLMAPPVAGKANTVINVVHEGMQNLSLDQYKDATIASMKPRMPGFELKDDGEIEAGNLEGKWFIYKMNMGTEMDAINYTFPKDNVAYILTGVTPAGDMDKYKSTFDAVARSFKLKTE